MFERKYVYAHPGKLDPEAMRAAAAQLIGEHDFSAFCTKRMKKSAVRRLESIEITEQGGELRIMLTGNGFLYNMVRIIVGTLIEVGRGERDIESVAQALSSLDRQQAGFTAPSNGLFLWSVEY